MSIKHIQRIYKFSVYYIVYTIYIISGYAVYGNQRGPLLVVGLVLFVVCCWICSFVCVALLHCVLYIWWAGTYRFIPIWSESIFVQAQSRSYEQTHMQTHAPSHTHPHTPTLTHPHPHTSYTYTHTCTHAHPHKCMHKQHTPRMA